MPKRKNNTPVVEPSVDFSKLTVVLLKKECQQRNLETSGRKVELIKRFEFFMPFCFLFFLLLYIFYVLLGIFTLKGKLYT